MAHRREVGWKRLVQQLGDDAGGEALPLPEVVVVVTDGGESPHAHEARERNAQRQLHGNGPCVLHDEQLDRLVVEPGADLWHELSRQPLDLRAHLIRICARVECRS